VDCNSRLYIIFNLMQEFLIASWINPWWTLEPESAGGWSYLYSSFNIVEGIFWVGFAIIVLRRYLQHRKSYWEIGYSFVFLLFGLTDFIESSQMSVPLLMAKAVILVVLFSLRSFVRKKYYPSAWY
jgi:hypothetical protein